MTNWSPPNSTTTGCGRPAKTIGGIVRAGEPILDIVPAEDALVIEARLSPTDINIVAIGQMARVHLSPYAARHMAPLDGHLVRISPDAMIDEVSRDSYFEVRIEVDPATLDRLATDVEMTPGMPAQVYIVTGGCNSTRVPAERAPERDGVFVGTLPTPRSDPWPHDRAHIVW